MSDDIIPEAKDRGKNFGRAVKLLAWLLLRWCRGQDTEQKHTEGLGDIALDKLLLVLFSTWNHLHARHIVGFRLPFEVRRGRHGRGCTLRKHSDDPDPGRQSLPAYLPEIIKDFNDRLPEEKRLFQRIGVRKRRGVASCAYGPAFDPAKVGRWLKQLQPDEQRAVRCLADRVQGLSEEELRALGTHEGFAETRGDLEHEARGWQRHMGSCLRALPESPPGEWADDCFRTLAGSALDALACARELSYKSSENREPYTAARAKLVEGCSPEDEDLKETLTQVFADAEAIWEAGDMLQWTRSAQALIHYSTYLHQASLLGAKLCGLGVGSETRYDEPDLERGERARQALCKELSGTTRQQAEWLSDLPQLDAIDGRDSEIWSRFRTGMTKAVPELLRMMPSFPGRQLPGSRQDTGANEM